MKSWKDQDRSQDRNQQNYRNNQFAGSSQQKMNDRSQGQDRNSSADRSRQDSRQDYQESDSYGTEGRDNDMSSQRDDRQNQRVDQFARGGWGDRDLDRAQRAESSTFRYNQNPYDWGGQDWSRNNSAPYQESNRSFGQMGEGMQANPYGSSFDQSSEYRGGSSIAQGHGQNQNFGQSYGQNFGQNYGQNSSGSQGRYGQSGPYGQYEQGGKFNQSQVSRTPEQSQRPSEDQRWSSHQGKGPKGFKRSDDRIKEDISEMLTHDHTVDASDIEIEVKEGEVTLTGTVSDRSMKFAAESLADRCMGVKDVHNQLRLKREDTTSDATTSAQNKSGAKKTDGKTLQ